MTAPGWYHAAGDPEGTQRYWDGNQWVGEAQAAQAAAPAAQPGAAAAPPSGAAVSTGGPPAEAQLDRRWAFGAIGAAVLALIGTIGPWASFLGVNLNGSETDDGKIVIGAAIVGGIAAVAALVQPAGRRWIRIVSGICGAIVLLIFLGNYGDVSDIGIAWGFWVTGLGGIAMLALAIAGDRFLPSGD